MAHARAGLEDPRILRDGQHWVRLQKCTEEGWDGWLGDDLSEDEGRERMDAIGARDAACDSCTCLKIDAGECR